MNLGRSGLISELDTQSVHQRWPLKGPRRSCSASLGKLKPPSPTTMTLVLRVTNRALGHLQRGPIGGKDLRFIIRMRNGGMKRSWHGLLRQSVCKWHADMDKRKQRPRGAIGCWCVRGEWTVALLRNYRSFSQETNRVTLMLHQAAAAWDLFGPVSFCHSWLHGSKIGTFSLNKMYAPDK